MCSIEASRAAGRPQAAALALLLASLLGAGCGSDGDAGTTSPAAWTVPDPDRTEMQEPVAEAIVEARRAVVRAPQTASTWGRYGQVLDAHEILDDAVECYRRAETLAPDDFRWSYLRAIALETLGTSTERILPLYERAEDLQPQFPPIAFRMGELLSRRGRLEDARRAYARALELDDSLAIAERGLGQVLLLLDQPDRAVTHLDRAESLVPGDRAVAVALAQAHARRQERELAQQWAEAAQQRADVYRLPDAAYYEVTMLARTERAMHDRVQLALAAGDYAAALEDLERLLRVDERNPTLLLQQATALLRTGRVDEAVTTWQRALRLDDTLAGAWLGLGVVMLDRGQTDAAVAHLRRAIEAAPRLQAAHARLATALAQQRDLAGALTHFERAAEIGEVDAQTHYNWAVALRQSGDPVGASEHFTLAVERFPRYANAHFQLGLLAEESGRVDAAVGHYRNAIAIDPRHAAAERLRRLGVAP
jgi:tetratricopeptide (TPR) repeat protein